MAALLRTAAMRLSVAKNVAALAPALAPASTRLYAATADSDFVFTQFKELENKFFALQKARNGIPIPLDPTDEPAIKAYSKAVEDAKAKAGILSTPSRIDALLDAAQVNNKNVRGFLNEASVIRATLGVTDSNVEAQLLAALDKVEAALGKPLLFSDSKGLAAFQKEAKDLVDEASKANFAELEATVKLDEAKAVVEDLRKTAQTEVDAVKARFNLGFLPEIDPKSLKPVALTS